jgi:predicted nuclease with TOPRIM domain
VQNCGYDIVADMKKVATQNELYEIIIRKIDGLENRFGTLEEKVGQLGGKVNELDGKVSVLGEKVTVLDEKVDILGEKVGTLDEKVDQMSGRLYFVEKTTLAIRDDIKGVTSVLQNHDIRISNLELA